jgi:hypothetical protein
MALDSITLAISPYIARVNKAVKFYADNYSLVSNQGLMLAIAEGPILAGTTSSGWPIDSTESEVVPLPSLNTYDLDNVIGFKRVKNISFVIPDNTGYISIGGNTWSKLNADTYTDLIKLVYVKKSRWIYVEAELLPTEFVNKTYRQIGLYSSLQIADGIDYAEKDLFLPSEIKQVEKTTTLYDNRLYEGFLEVYQNKVATSRSSEYKEIFAWVLEF